MPAKILKKIILADSIVIFEPHTSGFPSRVMLKEQKGVTVPLIINEAPPLRLVCGKGTSYSPCLDDVPEASPATIRGYNITGGAQRLEISGIKWKDKSGKYLENASLSLRHEFWQDGTCFTSTFFCLEDNYGPDISEFSLTIPVHFPESEDVRWGFFPRPMKGVDGAFIQTIATARFIPSGTSRVFEGQIIPDMNFNCFRKKAPGLYCEFFMEGHNSLSGKIEDVETSLSWTDDRTAAIKWNFQKNVCMHNKRPYQWQNQYGWIIAKAPVTRRFPPFRMYHYLDNFVRYPDIRQIKKIAEAGADALVTHENWRLDPQNGAVPYDHARFNKILTAAKKSGIRLALYIRGDELSASEESCDWFDALLTKGKDGLYMDYGGPIHETLPPNERFHGGRIAFRRHYLKLRRYRERIGEDGFFLSHTGPFFSALGMTGGLIDGYVSGEGERGLLIKGRKEHEYYSEAFASHGSMWTAAFPEYGTEKMIPYLAAAGQMPHAPLGTQVRSSSLAHPGEPGINDVHLRPLWKLWGLFKGQKNIGVYSDYNCYGVLCHKTGETGGYLMVNAAKDTALFIITNFSSKPQEVCTRINWADTGFKPVKGCIRLCAPDSDGPGKPMQYDDTTNFKAYLKGYGVAGWFFSCDEKKSKVKKSNAKQTKKSTDITYIPRVLKEYCAPYPVRDTYYRKRLEAAAVQRSLRLNPVPAKKIFLRVAIPELAIPYEDSLYWDLYENSLALGKFENGDFVRLGWISRNGLVHEEPKKKDFIWPGEQSGFIDLSLLLQPGTYHLGIQSFHQGEPFYSFITASLSHDTNGTNQYDLEFMNEVEPDRAFITWTTQLV